MLHFRNVPYKSAILPLLLALLIGCSNAVSPQEMSSSSGATTLSDKECGDVLSQFGTKPRLLEFLECTVVDAPQVALSVRYRIPGNSAESIEDFLQKEYGMNELHFACCVWEPKEGGRGNLTASGRYFSITMNSDETLIAERTQWKEIPYFYVVVEELVNI